MLTATRLTTLLAFACLATVAAVSHAQEESTQESGQAASQDGAQEQEGGSDEVQDLDLISGRPVIGNRVDRQVDEIYERGLQFLAAAQKRDGSWTTSSGFGSETAGVCGICVLAFLSSGEDPNFGPYAVQVRRGLRHIILQQSTRSGLFEGNVYDYGFAMLCLAEAYGAVDDELLWSGVAEDERNRTIGEALELAVRAAQVKDSRPDFGGPAWWSTASDPSSGVTDTSVAGSVLVGLLAARNAGIAVPDKTIDRCIQYFRSMANRDGTVGYYLTAGDPYGNSMARTSIMNLVLAIAKRRDLDEFAASTQYLKDHIEDEYDTHPLYGRYYMAQALFQCDIDSWARWNREMIAKVENEQNDDGSIGVSPYGKNYSTAISLLSLALNYRFLPIYER
ncbi:MAG: squalene--hopene cyclase [Planctomycetota bacterium]